MVKYENWEDLEKTPVKRKKLVSLLTHSISLLDGTVIPPSGGKAYLDFSYGEPDNDKVMNARVKAVRGIPDPAPDTLYIVSSLVAKHVCRPDVVAPASNHKDRTYNLDGDRHGAKVLSVPGFLRFLRN